MGDPSYILLMRHGEHRDGRLTMSGKRDLVAVAKTLAGTITEQDVTLSRILWVRSGADSSQEPHEAQESARFLCEAIKKRAGAATSLDVEEVESFQLPGAFERSEVVPAQLHAVSDILARFVDWRSSSVLLVGNAPGINWLASSLVGRPLSLQRSEIFCLRRSSRRSRWNPRRWLEAPDWAEHKWCNPRRWFAPANWDLVWTIAPSDPKTGEMLRAKIKSKMDVAKVFGGVVVAVFTFLVGELFDEGVDSLSDLAALYATAASAVLYFATLFAYDSLQMPTRFWGETVPRGDHQRWLVQRPPSSDTWILYQNMLRAWNRLFIPATALLAVGLLSLWADTLNGAAPANEPATATPGSPPSPEVLDLRLESAVGLAVTVVVLWLWVRHHRPRFGAHD